MPTRLMVETQLRKVWEEQNPEPVPSGFSAGRYEYYLQQHNDWENEMPSFEISEFDADEIQSEFLR